jgi:regulatory protein
VAFGQLSLKGRALRLLSQREHSCSELAAKLARHVTDDDVEVRKALVAETVDELSRLGFVSDERTADSVVHSKGQRYGVMKIRQALQAKGLSADLISSALEKAGATELETARQVWSRRFGKPAENPKEYARQHRFLTSRGFSAQTVRLTLDARARFDED